LMLFCRPTMLAALTHSPSSSADNVSRHFDVILSADNVDSPDTQPLIVCWQYQSSFWCYFVGRQCWHRWHTAPHRLLTMSVVILMLFCRPTMLAALTHSPSSSADNVSGHFDVILSADNVGTADTQPLIVCWQCQSSFWCYFVSWQCWHRWHTAPHCLLTMSAVILMLFCRLTMSGRVSAVPTLSKTEYIKFWQWWLNFSDVWFFQLPWCKIWYDIKYHNVLLNFMFSSVRETKACHETVLDLWGTIKPNTL